MRLHGMLLVAGLLAWGAPASAREYEMSWGTSVHRIASASMEALSDGDFMTMADFGLGARMGSLPILGPIHVEGQLSFGTRSANDFGQIDTELSLVIAQVGLRGERPVRWPWLRGYARADLGLTMGELQMTGGSAAPWLSDSDRSLSAYGATGLEATLLHASESWRDPDLALVARLEIGYLASRELSFAAKPAYPDDDLNRIDTVSSPLGSADVSGLNIRFNLVGRF